jgi:ABC-type transport system substrate-binding protein
VDQVLFAIFDSKSTLKESQLNDPRLDEMIARARTLVDEAERLKAYNDVQTYIAQQIYVAPIGGQYVLTLLQPRVQNFQAGSDGGEAVETFAGLWLKQ